MVKFIFIYHHQYNSMNGEQMPDVDGEQYFEVADDDAED